MQRGVNIKNSKFNNNGNNSYEIKSKTYNMKDLIDFPEEKNKYLAED